MSHREILAAAQAVCPKFVAVDVVPDYARDSSVYALVCGSCGERRLFAEVASDAAHGAFFVDKWLAHRAGRVVCYCVKDNDPFARRWWWPFIESKFGKEQDR